MKAGPFPIHDSICSSAFATLADALSGSAFVPVRRSVFGEKAVEPATPRVGFWERLDRWAWRQVQKEREAYLSQAQNLAELEERMRRLDSYRSRFY